jgi:hypothetical protein
MNVPVSRVDRHEPLNVLIVVLVLTAIGLWILVWH